MTNPTNTGSGSIAQGQGSTAAGERGIAAGSVSGSTIATGDNATINNIIIVGRFLEFAQVEELLPKIEDREDFSSIAKAIEGALDSRLDTDLTDAVAFAGEILSDFVQDPLEKYTNKAVPLTQLVPDLIEHVARTLHNNGYWQAYADGSTPHLFALDATTMLYTKSRFIGIQNVGIKIQVDSPFQLGISGIECQTSPTRYCLVVATTRTPKHADDIRYDEFDIKRQTPKDLRIIIAGIVLDLIRIYSDNRISVQFLQELSGLFKSHKSNPHPPE